MNKLITAAVLALALTSCKANSPIPAFLIQQAIPGPVTFQADVLDKIRALDINFEVVDVLPIEGLIDPVAVYMIAEHKIYFKRSKIGNSGSPRFIGIVVHEAIHYLHVELEGAEVSPRIREAIAVYGIEAISEALGMKITLYHKDSDFKKSLRVNNLPEEGITDQEFFFVAGEVLQILKIIKNKRLH
jgi:hypothetical protein